MERGDYMKPDYMFPSLPVTTDCEWVMVIVRMKGQ